MTGNSSRCWLLIQQYLEFTNQGVLKMHLCNVGSDDSGKLYDNTQQNIDDVFRLLTSQLSQCQKGLSVLVSAEESKVICTLLAIYTDEDVLTGGLYPRKIFWPKLQLRYIGNREGGIAFYDLLDEALSTSVFVNEVYEVFEHLLERGYKGRYLNDIAKIKQYRKALSDVLDAELSARA